MTIVPTNRLILWTALTLLPASIIRAGIPGTPAISYLPVLILFLAALIDAVITGRQKDTFFLEFPLVVRMIENRETVIPFQALNRSQSAQRLRLGLGLPEHISSARDMSVALLPEASQSNISWNCTPGMRGEFYINRCRVETESFLNLWSKRREVSINTQLRVYPDLSPEKKYLAWLLAGRQSGVHALRQIGKGRDFEQLREYLPGDSYEDIHWKATARRGFPVTKTYQIERTQEVYMVIDASRLSGRRVHTPFPDGERRVNPADGKPNRLQGTRSFLDHFIATVLMSGLAIERQGDLFGLLSFDDRIRGFVKARNGKAHYDTCRDMLYNLYPKRVSPDFNELFSFIGNSLRKRAMLIFLTSLDDPVLADGFVKNAQMISNRHVILVNMINPEGVAPIFSSSPLTTPKDLYTALSGHLEWENIIGTKNRLKRMGIDFSMVEGDKLSLQLTRQYLAVKRSQLL